ncbi:YlmC/YmxH family sporulation protein [Paenibacillus thermoaerophilus]|uniref:YlmC/YmxH family sporulation protein n=1 Tax=Paenibacillus thermoaerophilus TaxID=1215385 RepID=A0ABW2UXR6_9BACL|nr:YlmC/YmxH family sporulation protein [Paenibacillus thermoaerophilus]TMV19088.1 YlmC/YmxH family sporulation protein [Paenibacillus thermoaerophilus]
MKISDFQTKDVINIVDGKKLGTVSDLELDLRQGRIDAIVVPSGGKFFGWFAQGADLVIPWRNIVKIGMDVVLVKLDEARSYRLEEETGASQGGSSAYASSGSAGDYNRPYRP